jgi:acyl-CoA synthetase (AMP-forming)/AMP-acid ligase II/acyl carrier protein
MGGDQDVALLAPERSPLSFAALIGEVARVAVALVERGVQPGDPVGLLGPNGPEMAVLFLAVASVGVAAPLNPALRRAELEFEVDDLGLRAVVVVDHGGPADRVGASLAAHPVEAVAAAAGITVLHARLRPDQPAGLVTLTGGDLGPMSDPVAESAAGPRFDPSVGLVLHTSGTTARPKIVPLTRANLRASAANVAASLALTPDDRGLELMPLFHVHGLVAGLLAPLHAGSSVICAPGFLAPEVPRWCSALTPTWLTAVPTMHQALIDRLTSHPSEVPTTPLRFLRSSSASLATQVMVQAEQIFGAPLVEAYGMTEAAHQIAANPRPPGERRAGTVGRAAGPDVAVLGVDGTLVPAGVDGEIVIRGDNVMVGYDAPPEVNAAAFHDGWFRTGDQGRLGDDGYLTITGRLKEIINRGGEKISPREIDEVLLDHPAVAQAVTFAVPDRRLGEIVAAAVVAAPGASPGERDLREFVALRLAPFKVPRRVVVLDELPLGATGKVQRIGLADRLDLADLAGGAGDIGDERPCHTPPRSEIERFVAALWAEVLVQPDPSVLDHFLDLGGDSMLATRLLAAVREQLDLEISVLDFFDRPTIAGQAQLIGQLLEAEGG